MNIDSFLPKLAISALCMALVTACGGGDDSSVLLDKDGQKVGFLQIKDKKKEEKKEEIKKEVDITPTNTVPSVDKFLSSESGKKVAEGQQLSPTVSLMQAGDANPVRFDQPGIVSEFSPSPEAQIRVNEIQKDVDERKKQIDEIQKDVDELNEQIRNSRSQQERDRLESDLRDRRSDLRNRESALRNRESDLRKAKLAAEKITMLDINGKRHELVTLNTLDFDKMNAAKILFPGFNDAGVVKIDKIRTRHADGSVTEEAYQGNIGREFNEVILFARAESNTSVKPVNNFLDMYLRAPSQAGWSYQTFGSFRDENLKANRGLDIGYQSVGNQTTELPTEGKATYKGISVAHYNNDQITMRNEIKADFGSRHLSYKTTEAPYHHTLGKEHIIEARQDLALTGEATWKKGINHFEGKMTAENGLSGKIEGRFYGPGAQEVGGVFGLKGQVNGKDAHYVGGFGAAIK